MVMIGCVIICLTQYKINKVRTKLCHESAINVCRNKPIYNPELQRKLTVLSFDKGYFQFPNLIVN